MQPTQILYCASRAPGDGARGSLNDFINQRVRSWRLRAQTHLSGGHNHSTPPPRPRVGGGPQGTMQPWAALPSCPSPSGLRCEKTRPDLLLTPQPAPILTGPSSSPYLNIPACQKQIGTVVQPPPADSSLEGTKIGQVQRQKLGRGLPSSALPSRGLTAPATISTP